MCDQETKARPFGRADATLAIALIASLLGGCDRSAPEPTVNNQAEAPAETTPAPKLPAPAPALSRADLVTAAAEAASAYAAGERAVATDALVDRTFAIRIAFGCSGPTPPPVDPGQGSGLASWSWGPDNKTVDLRMTPGDWTGSALITGSGDAADWEAVEGFWIPRPWLTSDSCPDVRADPLQTAGAAAAPQTLGLAAIFEAEGSRIGRRNGRAYEFTIRPDAGSALKPPPNGYRLVLEGRVAAYPNGRAIRCRAAGPDQRPVCVVATKLDRVAFEQADGKVLSEWRPG